MSDERMDGIRETAERVLRSALVNAVLRDRSGGATQEEQEAAIAPLEGHTKATLGMLNECMEQARLAGANEVHQAIHKMPGADHEMLDEMAEFAPADGTPPNL